MKRIFIALIAATGLMLSGTSFGAGMDVNIGNLVVKSHATEGIFGGSGLNDHGNINGIFGGSGIRANRLRRVHP